MRKRKSIDARVIGIYTMNTAINFAFATSEMAEMLLSLKQ